MPLTILVCARVHRSSGRGRSRCGIGASVGGRPPTPSPRRFAASVLILATLLFSPQLALAQFTQQGPKLVGIGSVGNARQGSSVALSADGNTAILGGPGDNSGIGAAWVFVQTVPSLQVTPTSNMVAAGNPGGPFSPSSFQYQLSATGGTVNYSISGVPNWLTASSTSGTASTGTTVTFTVNANANGLAVGTYGPITITFTNSDTENRTIEDFACPSARLRDAMAPHVVDILRQDLAAPVLAARTWTTLGPPMSSSSRSTRRELLDGEAVGEVEPMPRPMMELAEVERHVATLCASLELSQSYF